MLNSEAATEREQQGSLNYPADYAAVLACGKPCLGGVTKKGRR
jgi:hypothetical protein